MYQYIENTILTCKGGDTENIMDFRDDFEETDEENGLKSNIQPDVYGSVQEPEPIILKPLFLTVEEKTEYAEKHQGLIYSISRKFSPRQNVDYNEYISIAQVGFVKALNTYDKNKGAKFSTYATRCMSNEIKYFLRMENKHINNDISLDAPIASDKNGRDTHLEDKIADNSKLGENVDANLMRSEKANALYTVMEFLNDKERYIITYRYGLNNGIVKTQKEIASNIGMSQANVSKLERNILQKLNAAIAREIPDFTLD